MEQGSNICHSLGKANRLNRNEHIAALGSVIEFDICIIGGGATGLGIAVDAASRGFKTVLFEKSDFAKGTSSRSTKLVHGGVRYLQQGNIKMVLDSLKERGLLKKNAPHLVKNQSFIIPNYKWWENPFYGVGLKVYDWMAGNLGMGPSQFLSREETLELLPNLDPDGLKGGVLYHDGQFDDARLAIHLAMTAADHGAIILNYFPVNGLIKEHNKVSGVLVTDEFNGKKFEIKAKAVINATGVFTDDILNLDKKSSRTTISPSQGIHLVFDKEFLPSANAVMIPKTDDGRVLFAVPWYNKIIVGTTDTPVTAPVEEPVADEKDIRFVLTHISRYLSKDPEYSDIRSVFAGLRPLVKGNSINTAGLSRDHLITISESELITITGGKWTTYRKMAEDVIEVAIQKAGLPEKECLTKNLPVHGHKKTTDPQEPLACYGTDKEKILGLIKENKFLSEQIHPSLPYINAEIIWAVRHEMCQTIEDALCRRTRALFLDARAAIVSAPAIAGLMAKELNKDQQWIEQQIRHFSLLAKNYLPPVN